MKKILTAVLTLCTAFGVGAKELDWKAVEKKAEGQTVYFHAWGGSQEINRYIQWANNELQQQYSVTLQHVKVTDIAESTPRLIAEKAVGKSEGGSIDLVWVNGENFKSMKENTLLFGPFTESLPNWQYVDQSLPVAVDFSEPTEGLEAPWGVGQLVFIYDEELLVAPPTSFAEMLRYAKQNPNRLSYPKPPEFHGTSFLKALLIELSNNDPALSKTATEEDFARLSPLLWTYLDEFHSVAWRRGKQFPAGTAEMIRLLDDGQLDLALTFNPNAVYSAQAAGNLEYTTKPYAMNAGALSNIHFLAIPWNATAKEGALVAINFLLSPEAQSHKGDLAVWGDPSVLEHKYLKGSAQASEQFEAIDEPHPSWQVLIEKEWLKRYGQ
ncbi:ABC transporter substrate-binding protein [Vibrio inusitatus NBRC 102082]|uniref:ABC transporter substrate-binding protein n=1 Tax=Vibrio inusitatus NBRC 102082 TaxID=1219070 RepID=A0A4Y3HQ02_9VIBR|nr:ABC transporter substrate-binding protein [Vibrio inusitatus]GEA49233.1 ABC transporter substrate-binding protein [Vibrio inusitatus NBRC 102082]